MIGSLESIEFFSIDTFMFDETIDIFDGWNDGTDFFGPISEIDEFIIGVDERFDHVFDTCLNVFMKDLYLHEFIEVYFRGWDNTLHNKYYNNFVCLRKWG